MDGLAQRVLAKCPAKTLDRFNKLLEQGLCLQAIASTPLRMWIRRSLVHNLKVSVKRRLKALTMARTGRRAANNFLDPA